MDFSVEEIKDLPTKDKPYRVREKHGLAIRIMPNGVKRFEYIYQSPLDGKRRFMQLGIFSTASPIDKVKIKDATTLKQAYKKHSDARALVLQGIDPQATEPEQSNPDPEPIKSNIMTIEMLVDRYIKSIDGHLHPRTVKHHKERLAYHITPALKPDRDITSVKRLEALDLIDKISKTHPGAARNAASSASALFEYAIEWGILESNPFRKATKTIKAARPKQKKRFHSPQEIKYLVNNLKPLNDRFHNISRLLLYTAQRPNEGCGMAWLEIHDDMINKKKLGRWWLIPQVRAQKNDQDNLVYLVSPVRRMLLRIKAQKHISQYVFPATRGSISPTVVNSLDTFVEKRFFGKPCGGLQKWEPHDFRRTFSSNIPDIGCPSWISDLITDHKLAGQAIEDGREISKISGNYNYNVYMSKRREWLIRWAWYLRKISRDKELEPIA